MFANNNYEVVRRLARRSLTAHKKRNMIAAATIALAVCVMLVLALFTIGSLEVSYQKGRGYDQAYFSWVDTEQLDAIQNHPALVDVSVNVSLNTLQQHDAIIRSIYVSDNHYANRLDNMPLIGSTPKAFNEIVVQRSMLQYLDCPIETGQEILLDLGYGLEGFVVSGYLDNEDVSRDFPVQVSKEYMEAHIDNPIYTVRVNLRDSGEMEPAEIKEQLVQTARELGLEDVLTIRSVCFDPLHIQPATLIYIFSAAITVAFACAIVVYSMFYISVSGKTQEYGRLKVIGATSKMLRRIVRIETLYLSTAGIVVGNLVGCLIGYLMIPDGWRWPVTGVCVLLVSLLTVLTVCISTRTPVKLAGKVAPVEAIKMTPYTTAAGPGETKQLQRNLTPRGLAWIGFQRNPQKAVLTFCSLGLAGTILMCVATFQNSLNAEGTARQDYPHGEYGLELQLHAGASQTDNPLNDDFEQALYAIDGVSGVMTAKAVMADVELPRKDGPMNFTGLTREQLASYGDLRVEGTVDYDELAANRGMIIDLKSRRTIKEVFGLELEVGTQLIVHCTDGSSIPLTVLGITSSDLSYGIGGAFLSIPDDLMPTINPEVENFTAGYKVKVLEDNDEVRQKLFAIASNYNLDISSMQDYMLLIEAKLRALSVVFYGLSVFIALFSLINLANTLITNLIARQQELGILQSIGMSNTQLKTMLRMECLFYVIGTIFITGTVGTAASMLLCAAFNKSGSFGSITYQFPVWVFAAYLLLLLAAYFIYQIYAVNTCTKKPLVERISAQ